MSIYKLTICGIKLCVCMYVYIYMHCVCVCMYVYIAFIWNSYWFLIVYALNMVLQAYRLHAQSISINLGLLKGYGHKTLPDP